MSSITLLRPERERATDQKTEFAHERHSFPPAVSVALGWTGAALGVYAVEFGARGLFTGVSRPVVALAKIAMILIAGAVYARSARGAPSGFVLASGVAWLVFSICADVITGIGSAGAYQLLGDPRVISATLRDATIFAWLGAPALFVRGGEQLELRDPVRRHP
jgi:hypothetical protein